MHQLLRGIEREQEEIEQIITHTKFDILQRKGLIWIWITLYLSIHSEY